MARQRIAKSMDERRVLDELLALASRYTGEVKRLPPGEARGHETAVDYEQLRLPRSTPASSGR
jgi:hypothetical protein